ncbi:cytosine permease, partial [Erwinia amylovora]|nr:cytosine permease [Erwinia amylovora]
PYVSDYSRYLPRTVSAHSTYLAVFCGSVLGPQASMTLGVMAAALAGSAFSGNEVGYIVGLGSGGMMALVLSFAICFGKITFSTLNAYGSFLSVAT